jgi:hypothetical protein
MLAALQTADEPTRFFLRVYLGNYSLFLAGVFPDRIRFRAEARGSPGLKRCVSLGRTQDRMASGHRLACRFELTHALRTLSERSQASRLALNDMAERLFSLGDTDDALEALSNTARNQTEWQPVSQLRPPARRQSEVGLPAPWGVVISTLRSRSSSSRFAQRPCL